MPKVLVNEENLTNIANAIREKNGETTTYLPSEMASAIQNISSGGGESNITTGIVINKCESSGYPTDISLVGLTTIPNYYCYVHSSGMNNSTFYAVRNINFLCEPVSIGSYAFHGFFNNKISKIPSSVTSIGEMAFYNNGIENLEIQGNVTNIGSSAFAREYAVGDFYKQVTLPNVTSVPTLGANAFYRTSIASGTGYIYVPDDLVDSFKSATNWSTYADQIKSISELEASA